MSIPKVRPRGSEVGKMKEVRSYPRASEGGKKTLGDLERVRKSHYRIACICIDFFPPGTFISMISFVLHNNPCSGQVRNSYIHLFHNEAD